jgi:phosphoribosyl 1,2-cyclic phosphate phosphodiesterase
MSSSEQSQASESNSDGADADDPNGGPPTAAGTVAPPLQVTLLGTGTSTGVPVIGCDCEVCTSDDPRDTRTRCAAYVRAGSLGILIDTGPDLREQMLREDVERIDAVLYTHHHFDHLVGIDDLRPFFFRNSAPMPCFANTTTAEVMQDNYDYIFGADPYPGAARVELREVDAPFDVTSRYGEDERIRAEPVPLFHGDMPVFGYRIGRFAYLTDVSDIPEASFDRLHNLDVLVLDALRPDPHPTHYSFDEAVRVARRIGARETYFIHMTHNVRHAVQEARLPDDVHLGYDGLTLDVKEGKDWRDE